MKPLVLFCFTIFVAVLSVLSCFNFAFEPLDRIEEDKITCVIEKPESKSNTEFLNDVSEALDAVNADIMFRYLDATGERVHYQYYKTSHTENFVELLSGIDGKPLKQGECQSTTNPDGYMVYHLNVPSLLQDVSFFPWSDAKPFNLNEGTYYVKIEEQSKVKNAIEQLGYTVTMQPASYVSGQFSVLLFSFVPAFMLVISMIFYVLSNGKRNVLKKMEGYTTQTILLDEGKELLPMMGFSFGMVQIVHFVVAAKIYTSTLPQYTVFFLQHMLGILFVLVVGFASSALLTSRQHGSDYIKGKVPKRGIYIATMVSKVIFLAFCMFFLSIAVRNGMIAYHSMETAEYFAEKMTGYVTIPVNTRNTSVENLKENYMEFYSETVDRYQGVLMGASNYQYSLISGTTAAEEFGQTYVTVNQNYLEFNPIYDSNGNQITQHELSQTECNVLIPISKEQTEGYWRELFSNGYQMDVNFIPYDGKLSKIYTYNADTGTGNYGEIEEPVILVVEEKQLSGAFVFSYCSQGSYFLKVTAENPYEALLPILQKTGIDVATPNTPTLSNTFQETIHHQQQMLSLYGTQSVVLLVGIVCLILFGAKLYCENDRDKIAYGLIEGYSLFHCLKKHLIGTIISYGMVLILLTFVTITTHVSIHDGLLLAALVGELGITGVIGQNYATKNLYQVVKGAE